jgi:threonine/homoserine/homoserine lactone efflux protein
VTDALGDVLPAALAVALSPVPVIAMTLVLTGARPRNGGWFALGWVLGLAALTAAVVLVVGAAASGEPDLTDDGVAWGTLVIGVGLLALAVRTWRHRSTGDAATEGPSWMDGLDDVPAGRAVALGVGLSALNPKNVALVLAAGSTIATAGLSATGRAATTAVFVLLGSASVLGLASFAALAPAAAARPLASVRAFMVDHADAILIVVLVLLGSKLVGDALGLLG